MIEDTENLQQQEPNYSRLRKAYLPLSIFSYALAAWSTLTVMQRMFAEDPDGSNAEALWDNAVWTITWAVIGTGFYLLRFASQARTAKRYKLAYIVVYGGLLILLALVTRYVISYIISW